jgi:pilus assembly protein CpaB
MRRGRVFIYLAFILIFGLVAVVLVYQRYLTPQNLEPAAAGMAATPVIDTVEVIVVAQRVPRGSAITETVLGTVPIQRDLFIQGMFTNINEVKGRLAKFDLDAGVPLTSGMLVESAEQLSATGSIAALSIPRGMVSISVPITRLSSVSYAPEAGDHVNVIVVMMLADYDPDFQTMLPNSPAVVLAPGPITPEFGPSAVSAYYKDGTTGGYGKAEADPVLGQTFYTFPSEPQRPRLVSQALLQDAVVLHVGDFLKDEPQQQEGAAVVADGQEPPPGTDQTAQAAQGNQAPAAQNGEEAPVEEPKGPDLISLIVTPQDAITLNYVIHSGAQLTLALRSAGDDTRVQTEAVTLQFLLDQYNIPVPAKLPFGIPNRDIDDKVNAPALPNDATPTPAP